MRLISLTTTCGEPLETFGSCSAKVIAFVPQGRVTLARVGQGGSIGTHAAPVDQLFVLISGDAHLEGSPESLDLAPGDAAFIEAGTTHQVTSRTGFIAVVIESPDLSLL